MAIGSSNINYMWAGLIVEELVRNGVTCFCIAPGSRSSALAVSAAKHPGVETVVHFDERGVGFYALGYASAAKKPAAIICSSGTAAANFLPAVIECSKKKLPMIVLTADRPPELRFTGALQTIDQVKIYGEYVRWFMDMPTPTTDIQPEMVLTTIDQAVYKAKQPMGGPVHLNCMFREPLAPDGDENDLKEYSESIEKWRSSDKPYTEYICLNHDSQDSRISRIIDEGSRGVVVVGKLGAKEEQDAVLRLAEKLGWPVFPDIVSGLRTRTHNNIIHYFDQVLANREWEKQFPVDTILHLGGRMTSKRFYQFVERIKPKHYITVLNHTLRNDPLHIVTHRVQATVKHFAESLFPGITPKPTGDHLEFLCKASFETGKQIDEHITEKNQLTEIATARRISELIPSGQGLFLSNSMPVRDMDMYAKPLNQDITIGGNRGASGIDGIIATTCGFANSLNRKTTLLIGDLAFLHDINSLALAKQVKNSLIIVVINNDGGGIFSFLPIAQSPGAADIFTPYFGTPHGLTFPDAARMFDFLYTSPTSLPAFEAAYKNALESSNNTIIEIKTNREENHKLHMELQERIKNSLHNMVK